MSESRWVSGEDSRRLVHVLRAASDAVAVGMGTVRWENPRLDARGVPAVRPAATARVRPGPLPEDRSSSSAAAPCARSSRRSPRTACSHSSSKAARRSRPRSSSRISSTSCSSSSRRSSRATVRECSPGSRRRSSSPGSSREPIGDDVVIQGTSTSPELPSSGCSRVRSRARRDRPRGGRVVSLSTATTGRRGPVQAQSETRSRSTGSASPSVAPDDGGLTLHVVPETLERSTSAVSPRAMRERRAGRCAPATRSAATTSRGTWTRWGACSRWRPRARAFASSSRRRPRSSATASRRAPSRSTASR